MLTDALLSTLTILKFVLPSTLDKDTWGRYINELAGKLAWLHTAIANDAILPSTGGDLLIQETIDFLKSKPEFTSSKNHSRNFISCSKTLEKAKSLKNTLRKAAKRSKNSDDQQAFYKALRAYNTLKRKRNKADKLKNTNYQESLYKKDFWGFSKSICAGTFGTDQISPDFNKRSADAYYPTKYSVPQPVDPKDLDWYTDISAPTIDFDLSPILPKHIRKIVNDKSGTSSPGPDGISYAIIKKLPCLHLIMATLYNKILQSGLAPLRFGQSKITLIYKKGDNKLPSNFRMIALSSTIGKIMHQILAERTVKFMIGNNYINPLIQKAFISKINGTIEHNQVLHEIIKHAKRNKKSFHI